MYRHSRNLASATETLLMSVQAESFYGSESLMMMLILSILNGCIVDAIKLFRIITAVSCLMSMPLNYVPSAVKSPSGFSYASSLMKRAGIMCPVFTSLVSK